MTQEKPRICLKCKHHDLNRTYTSYICKRPGASKIDLVTGKEKHPFCEVERKLPAPDYCSPAGKYYEEM